ncbi:MAG: Calx-beta domain-containing protein [Lysobacterales bacterium]
MDITSNTTFALVSALTLVVCADSQAVDYELAIQPQDPLILGRQADRETEGACVISGDGRYTVFASAATQLVPGDGNGVADLFVFDAMDLSLERLPRRRDGSEPTQRSRNPSISDDGRYLAFESDDDLLGVGYGVRQVYWLDRDSHRVEIVSKSIMGPQGWSSGIEPQISADGRYVAFSSSSDELVVGDSVGSDIFVWDAHSETIARVSEGPLGEEANGSSYGPQIDATGSRVLFSSVATNLIANDLNGTQDVFVKDLVTDAILLVSQSTSGDQADGFSASADLSADGSMALFTSLGNNLDPTDSDTAVDLYTHDLASGQTALVNTDAAGLKAGNVDHSDAKLSDDGLRVVFASSSEHLTGPLPGMGDVDHVFVKDLSSGGVVRLSDGSDGDAQDLAIDGDGQTVCFVTSASDEMVGDINGVDDAILVGAGGLKRPISLAETALPATAGNEDSSSPSISADGTRIAFISEATTLENHFPWSRQDFAQQVYLSESATSALTRVSNGMNGEPANDNAREVQISADGRFVVFSSAATNLSPVPDSGNGLDLFRTDLATGQTELITSTIFGAASNQLLPVWDVSQDGSIIVFSSGDEDLVLSDQNGHSDVFIWQDGVGISLLSVAFDGAMADDNSTRPRVSDDGNHILFESEATNLSEGFIPDRRTLYRRDRAAGITTPIITDRSPIAYDMSPDAAIAALSLLDQIFLYDISNDQFTEIATELPGRGFYSTGQFRFSRDGRYLLFHAYLENSRYESPYLFRFDRLDHSLRTLIASPEPERLYEQDIYYSMAANGALVTNWPQPLVLDDNNGPGTSDIYEVTLQSGEILLDEAPVTVSESAGTVTLTLLRQDGGEGAVSVNYAITEDTATANEDFLGPLLGSVYWSDTDISDKTITLDLVADNLVEGDETFTVTISDPQGGAKLGAVVYTPVTILDSTPRAEQIFSDGFEQ